MREEEGTGFVDDGARAVDMGDRVLIRSTEETCRDVSERNLHLMTHATKGGEWVVDKGDMVEKESRRETLAMAEI